MTKRRSVYPASLRARYLRIRRGVVKLAEKLGGIVGAILVAVSIALFFGIAPEGFHAWTTGTEHVSIVGPMNPQETPYGAFAAQLQRQLQKRGIEVDRTPSNGSFTSLVQFDATVHPDDKVGNHARPAERDQSKLAVVQADVAYHYIRGQHPQFAEAHDKSHVRALARLFAERLEIWRPADSEDCSRASGETVDPKAAEENLLALERLCASSVGSGTMITTRNVGRLLGARWLDYNNCQSSSRGEPELCMFGLAFPAVTASKPADLSGGMERCKPAGRCLRGFSADAVAILENSFEGRLYTRSRVDDGEAAPDNATFTIQWDALLVANQDLDHHLVEIIQDAIAEMTDRCAMPESAWVDPNERTLCLNTNFKDLAASRYRELPVALHPSVLMQTLDSLSYLLARLTDPRVLKIILLLLLGSAMLAGAIPTIGQIVRTGQRWTFVSRVAEFLLSTQLRWVAMLLTVTGFHLLIAILIWLSELHEHALVSDTDFISGGVFHAVDWMFRFVIMGGTDTPLKSSLAVFWVGILKLGWTVASAALLTALVTAAISGWRLINMERMVVVVGWNERGAALLKELDSQDTHCEVWLSGAQAADKTAHQKEKDKKVVYCDYEKEISARFKTAESWPRSVIVLSDREQAEKEAQGDVDSWVSRRVKRLSDLREEHRPKLPKRSLGSTNKTRLARFSIVAEVEYPANVESVRASGADDVVCLRRFATALLAQTATRPGLREIFDDLFETDPNTQEIYYDKLDEPSIAVYRTFERALQLYPTQKNGRIPIGIRRKNKNYLNPKGELKRLLAHDELIVMGSKPEPEASPSKTDWFKPVT